MEWPDVKGSSIQLQPINDIIMSKVDLQIKYRTLPLFPIYATNRNQILCLRLVSISVPKIKTFVISYPWTRPSGTKSGTGQVVCLGPDASATPID
ncbi:hypothetical protein AG1IA_00480 [Rhizoctonia solani AG-1 IA]|uniref:Uncharacterized protein n=1 Tax=Thanatephorus cucumeris (strain AG1-IA) TaxID=983506 RepID=L8X589_THACA|nr:hypothetical protein AG1IA_00480 [Rhizoctonia solani AG-1 IA]